MTLPWAVLVVALWVVVACLAVVVLGLLRRIGPVLEAAERTLHGHGSIPGDLGGLPAGARVPDFGVTMLDDGRDRRFADVLTGPLVVLFVQRHCPACESLLQALEATPDALGRIPLLVVADAAKGEELAALTGGTVRVAVQRDGEASRAFAQAAFPHAFAVGADGTVVAELVPASLDDLYHLAERLRDASPMPGRDALPLLHEGGSR